jgi:hypothetical protein
MSDIKKPIENATLEDLEPDSADDMLTVEPPLEDSKAKKKGMPKAMKIGLGVMGVGAFFLVAMNMMVPPVEQSQQQAGKIGVKIDDASNFKNAGAAQVATNPEAAALNNKVDSQRAGEILKDPSKSFVTADPFGSADVGNNIGKRPDTPDDQLAALTPPPAPPELVAPTPAGPRPGEGGGSNGEDPVLAYARKIHDFSTQAVLMGISPGNTERTQSLNTAGTAAAQANGNAQKILDSDVGAGEISYAQMTSALNSIVPQTPPRAIIRGGKLNGGILLGQMEVIESRYLVLRFTTLTLGKKTYPISAIAVNPEMQDAGMMDSVRDRTWTRAALQAGVGFVQAFGAAKLEEGTTSTQTPLGGTSTSVPKRSNGETAIIALGGAAQGVKGTVDQEIAKLKDEVKVGPGKEIGVLFMQPLTLQQ